jgi:uncharacterized membrane protein
MPHLWCTDLLQIQRRRRAAVVVVAVQVQHLLAVDAEQARQHALDEARAEHDHVVFLVHFFFLSCLLSFFLCRRTGKKKRIIFLAKGKKKKNVFSPISIIALSLP